MVPIPLIIAGVQAGASLWQMHKAKKLAQENERPEYQIPQEVKDKLSAAQLQALEGLPAEQKTQFINNVQRTMSFGMNAMNDRKGGLVGLSSLTQNTNDAYGNLLSQDAVAKQNNQRYLGSVQSEFGQGQNQAFDLNKLQPYQNNASASQALMGAGMQNLYGAVSSAGNSYMQQQYIDSMNDNKPQVGLDPYAPKPRLYGIDSVVPNNNYEQNPFA